ncbi:MAG: AlpA family phage regulatory protein [Proteobacteria bacterium]|nr:AlpA family phage regulatory protein [Pseudomonadota bacterium]
MIGGFLTSATDLPSQRLPISLPSFEMQNDRFSIAQTDAASTPSGYRPARFLTKKEVLRRVGCSYTTLWEMMVRGEFPRSRELGRRAVWVESEVEEFINNRPVRRLKGDNPVSK